MVVYEFRVWDHYIRRLITEPKNYSLNESGKLQLHSTPVPGCILPFKGVDREGKRFFVGDFLGVEYTDIVSGKPTRKKFVTVVDFDFDPKLFGHLRDVSYKVFGNSFDHPKAHQYVQEKVFNKYRENFQKHLHAQSIIPEEGSK